MINIFLFYFVTFIWSNVSDSEDEATLFIFPHYSNKNPLIIEDFDVIMSRNNDFLINSYILFKLDKKLFSQSHINYIVYMLFQIFKSPEGTYALLEISYPQNVVLYVYVAVLQYIKSFNDSTTQMLDILNSILQIMNIYDVEFDFCPLQSEILCSYNILKMIL